MNLYPHREKYKKYKCQCPCCKYKKYSDKGIGLFLIMQGCFPLYMTAILLVGMLDGLGIISSNLGTGLSIFIIADLIFVTIMIFSKHFDREEEYLKQHPELYTEKNN